VARCRPASLHPLLQSKFYARTALAAVDHVADAGRGCRQCHTAAEEKRSKKEERTQVLQLPTELPAVTTGNPRRLKFYVTPLTGKGLLTHQIREALKASSVNRAAKPCSKFAHSWRDLATCAGCATW